MHNAGFIRSCALPTVNAHIERHFHSQIMSSDATNIHWLRMSVCSVFIQVLCMLETVWKPPPPLSQFLFVTGEPRLTICLYDQWLWSVGDRRMHFWLLMAVNVLLYCQNVAAVYSLYCMQVICWGSLVDNSFLLLLVVSDSLSPLLCVTIVKLKILFVFFICVCPW